MEQRFLAPSTPELAPLGCADFSVEGLIEALKDGINTIEDALAGPLEPAERARLERALPARRRLLRHLRAEQQGTYR